MEQGNIPSCSSLSPVTPLSMGASSLWTGMGPSFWPGRET